MRTPLVSPEYLLKTLDQTLLSYQFGSDPEELYEPIRYIMALGGKRMRPLLTLLSYSIFKEQPERIVKPALAVEVFHNFTLMHDDIMDNAPIRRGKPTVHEKWNNNVAILSGDVMLVKAYDLLMNVPPALLKNCLEGFNICAAQVCEGQQKDMNFETRESVSEDEYLQMIELKTAVLLGFSTELGGLLGGADTDTCRLLRDFGLNIGIGFQLMDDLLDVYADPDKFGKQPGGDIVANKKTFLLIKALENSRGAQNEELWRWIRLSEFDPIEKVHAVRAIYDDLGIRKITEAKMNSYFEKAFSFLGEVRAPEVRKHYLAGYAQSLITRQS